MTMLCHCGNSLMLYCCLVLTTRLTKLTHVWL